MLPRLLYLPLGRLHVSIKSYIEASGTLAACLNASRRVLHDW